MSAVDELLAEMDLWALAIAVGVLRGPVESLTTTETEADPRT